MRFGDQALSYAELAGAAAVVAADAGDVERLAVWAEPSLETCVAVAAAVATGITLVPVNPKLGAAELRHVLDDSRPDVIVGAPAGALPGDLERRPREVAVDVERRAGAIAPRPRGPEDPALIVYTSGTTGAPKGAVLPRRAVASNLDALAEAWEWTDQDGLAHALPLFHVHGLVLGVLGPLRRGGALHHTGRFDSRTLAAALDQGATMAFGVPTMYHRLAEAASSDQAIGAALRRARLLVSGSAPLPAPDFEAIERASGQRVVERYGLTETLIVTSVRAGGQRRAGTVGPPLPGTDVRLVDDDGADMRNADDEAIGEVLVRGPSLFSGYLGRPEATAEAVRDGWFHTGDMATRAPDGYLRIVGRRSLDLIKTAGYKVGAGEVEAALLGHPGVAEAAVTGQPDADLGERIVAWVVARDGGAPAPEELIERVAGSLAPHKRPRDVRFVDELPRNAMGKVVKQRLKEYY